MFSRSDVAFSKEGFGIIAVMTATTSPESAVGGRQLATP